MRFWDLKAAALGLALLAAACVAAQAAPTGGGPSTPASTRAIDAEAAYAEGLAALAASDFKRAEKSFGQVLTRAPDHPEANYYMGLAKRKLGKDKQALKYFDRAVRARESFWEAREALALAAIDLGEADMAAAELNALRARIAACTSVSCDAATAALIGEAIARIETALAAATAPDAPATPGGGDPRDDEARAPAATRYGELLFRRGDEASAHFRTGLQRIHQERFVEAIDAFERAGALIGPHADIQNYLGYAARRLGRVEEAKAHYAAALALDPRHLGAHEYLGELYAETGDLARARRLLSRLDRLCPYGCAEREDLARRIAAAESVRSAAR